MTFANFGFNFNGYCYIKKLKNVDDQHPVAFKKNKIFNVDNLSKAWLFLPREELINMRHNINLIWIIYVFLSFSFLIYIYI